jgi:plastocyanin
LAWSITQFFPNNITITEDDTVTFQFVGLHSTTFTSDRSLGLLDNSQQFQPWAQFDQPFGTDNENNVRSSNDIISSGLRTSGNFTFQFPTNGRFPFHCVVHPWMQGEINVIPAQQGRGGDTPNGVLEEGAQQLANVQSSLAGIVQQQNLAATDARVVEPGGCAVLEIMVGGGNQAVRIGILSLKCTKLLVFDSFSAVVVP